MPPNNNLKSTTDNIQVTTGKPLEIYVCQITESELDLLEYDSPNSLFLNISISLLSIAISLFIAVVTTEVENLKIFTIFMIMIVVCAVAGIILFIFWWRNRKKSTDIIAKIRARMDKAPSSK